MNAATLTDRFAHATHVHLPVPAPRQFAAVASQPESPQRRRNRYARRDFGVGYGDSQGYGRPRTFLATPKLSRYR